ncbi:MAG TPA: hypothetical protein VNG33_01835 [Polyangiaceae bacterium]|nr:hypothetical protein [Polyangiaceae bacterium]
MSVGTTSEQLDYVGNGVVTGYAQVHFPPSVTLGTGDTMTFHGDGGAGAPMFDVSATIPGVGLMTSPVPASDGGAALIDTSGDLSVTWVPISIGQINFQLSGGSLGGSSPVLVTCAFDGASGTGVVPQKLLSKMKELSGERPAFADLSSMLDAATVVDGFTITTWSYQNSEDAIREVLVTLE